MIPLNRRDRLFRWWRGNHWSDDREVDEVALYAACQHLKFPPARVLEILRESPDAWNREMLKRECRMTGTPYPGANPRKIAGALPTNLKTRHPRKTAKMARKGVPMSFAVNSFSSAIGAGFCIQIVQQTALFAVHWFSTCRSPL